jgi:ribosome biogenesis protein ERB1
MGAKLTEKKRKSREPDLESDNELANGLFDGVLSQSDDEEDFVPSDEVDEDEDADGSGSEDTENSEDGEDGEDEDGILSDDIPSDTDGEEEITKLVKQQEELEITEPGVDPKPKGQGGDDGVNYRVEKDANGGERYVYECVALRRR